MKSLTAQNGLKTEGISLSDKILSSDGKYIYHISIIDYLQTYNWWKLGETYGKMIFLKAHMKDLSSVHPDIYADRFFKFMKDEVFAVIKRKNLNIEVSAIRDSNPSLQDEIKMTPLTKGTGRTMSVNNGSSSLSDISHSEIQLNKS